MFALAPSVVSVWLLRSSCDERLSPFPSSSSSYFSFPSCPGTRTIDSQRLSVSSSSRHVFLHSIFLSLDSSSHLSTSIVPCLAHSHSHSHAHAHSHSSSACIFLCLAMHFSVSPFILYAERCAATVGLCCALGGKASLFISPGGVLFLSSLSQLKQCGITHRKQKLIGAQATATDRSSTQQSSLQWRGCTKADELNDCLFPSAPFFLLLVPGSLSSLSRARCSSPLIKSQIRSDNTVSTRCLDKEGTLEWQMPLFCCHLPLRVGRGLTSQFSPLFLSSPIFSSATYHTLSISLIHSVP